MMLKSTVLDRRLGEAETSAVCNVLVTRLGGSYSRLLDIRLVSMESDEFFKWFVAAILLGSPMRPGSALAVYRALESLELLEPRHLASADEQELVDLLLVAGVTGYSRRIAATLRLAAESLVVDYDADINRLHFFAEDADDLVQRLRQLGRKVPRRAVTLFLREMRGVWDKAHPRLPESALEASRRLGILEASRKAEAADELRSLWERAARGGRTYADFEVALVRLGESFCRPRRCSTCPMGKLCINRELDALTGRIAAIETFSHATLRGRRNDETRR